MRQGPGAPQSRTHGADDVRVPQHCAHSLTGSSLKAVVPTDFCLRTSSRFTKLVRTQGSLYLCEFYLSTITTLVTLVNLNINNNNYMITQRTHFSKTVVSPPPKKYFRDQSVTTFTFLPISLVPSLREESRFSGLCGCPALCDGFTQTRAESFRAIKAPGVAVLVLQTSFSKSGFHLKARLFLAMNMC